MPAKKSKKKAPAPADKIKAIGSDKAPAKKASKIHGLVDGFVTLPFDVIGQERKRWQLQQSEKTKLREAVNGFLESKKIERLNDPGVYLGVVLMLIIVPRAALELRDHLANKKIEPAKKPEKRAAESDHTDIGEKGLREDEADYDGITSPGRTASIDSI